MSEGIDEKVSAVDKLAEELAGKLEVFERERTAAQRRIHEERDAAFALQCELNAQHLVTITDPNEMRRAAWRWYAGQYASSAYSAGASLLGEAADDLLAEEEKRFGKIGGAR